MVRPKTEIDIELAKKFCQLHCTGEEIAGYFEVDYDTLLARIKEHGYSSFSEFFSRFSAQGKISLRRKQFEMAMKGSVAMLSKLGDNWLAQSEKREITTKDVTPKEPKQIIIQVNEKPERRNKD